MKIKSKKYELEDIESCIMFTLLNYDENEKLKEFASSIIILMDISNNLNRKNINELFRCLINAKFIINNCTSRNSAHANYNIMHVDCIQDTSRNLLLFSFLIYNLQQARRKLQDDHEYLYLTKCVYEQLYECDKVFFKYICNFSDAI